MKQDNISQQQQQRQVPAAADDNSTNDDLLASPDPFAARPKIPRDEFDASIPTTKTTGTISMNNKSLSRSLVSKAVHDADKSIFKEEKNATIKNNRSVNIRSALLGNVEDRSSVVTDSLVESDGDDGKLNDVSSNDATFVDDGDGGERVQNSGDQSRDDFTTPKGICLYLINISQVYRSIFIIDDIAFKKKTMHSGSGGGSQERLTLCSIYDILIITVRFSFVLSPFRYHNVLLDTQM